jgi:ribonuclease HI
MTQRDELIAYADGATGHMNSHTGVGAILLTKQGQILAWGNRRLDDMTNNEAEYAGLVLALEMAAHLQPRRLRVRLDSEVVVGQMNGRCSVRSNRLKPWHRRACHLARQLKRVVYEHVPRQRNCLADALAQEALVGQLLQGP